MPFKEDSQIVNQLCQKIESLESRLLSLEHKFEEFRIKNSFQLIRIKNNEELSDQFISNSQSYRDLTPEKSFELYNNLDLDFTIVDVSESSFESKSVIPEVIKITLEDLIEKHHMIGRKSKSIFIISEQGIRSILACKKLEKLGFHNLNNISGGHKFWPGKNAISINSNFKKQA